MKNVICKHIHTVLIRKRNGEIEINANEFAGVESAANQSFGPAVTDGELAIADSDSFAGHPVISDGQLSDEGK